MSKQVKQKIAQIFNDAATAVETGNYGQKTKVAITTLGSELGVSEIVKGAELAAKKNENIDILLILV